jgi:replicative DNA helicase Mcm
LTSEETESTKYLDIDDITSERKNWNDTEKYQLEDGAFLSYTKVADKFDIYLRAFKRLREEDYHYFHKINQMMANDEITLVIEFNDIFDSKGREFHVEDMGIQSVSGDLIYDIMRANPRLFIKSMRKAAFKILSEINYDYAFTIKEHFRVVLANAVEFKKEINEINHSDINKLVYTENFIVSVSAQKNYTKSMAWSCGNCGKLTYKESSGTKLPRLRKCMFCESEDIAESNKDAVTETMMEVKLQEKYEKMASGRIPKSIIGIIYGKDMMNIAKAGDICGITGIIGLQRNASTYENAIADYVIEIEWIEPKPDDFLIEDDAELESRVKTFIDPKNEDEGYQTLIESIAPSVMGHEIIKEALLLQVVGSDYGFFVDNSRHRGELNILLCGDAGTAKTKLAYYCYQLYARAVYVSSKTTEAGITASVNIATKTGHAILEAGAYLLASSENGGIVILDEAEKTKTEARFATAACMDDKQMLEIHKHTIHQNIQINCASLHISNPKSGESWNTELTITENTGFENWYLSRFLPFIVRDDVDKELDTKKARHYMKQFGFTTRQHQLKDRTLHEIRRKQRITFGNKVVRSVPEMLMYNKYVRKNFHATIDPNSKAAAKLEKFYISIRPSIANSKSLRITMRSLGDLVRLCEASARAHCRKEVLEKDADIAIKIVQASIASSGFNMFTGEYEKKIKPSELGKDIPEGFFTAKDLLSNKAGAEIVGMDLQSLANKRQNRFYKEVALKMKKVVRVIKMYALEKCRDCRGEGYRNEGQLRNLCYSCQGHGGYKQDFNLNDLNYNLAAANLSNTDIHELTAMLIKKRVIAPRYENSSKFHVVKEYRDALLDLAGIEANISLAVEADLEKHKEQLIKRPEIQDKIEKLRRLMPKQSKEQIKKMLESVEEDEDDEDSG